MTLWKLLYKLILFLLIITYENEKSIALEEKQIFLKENSIKIYDKAPRGFQPAFCTSACYATFDKKYLMLQRQDHVYEPNVWGVPAGKLEKGESPLEAVLREVFEETGISLSEKKLSLFKTFYIQTPHFDFIFYMYTYEFSEKPNIKLNPLEHKNFDWMDYEEVMKTPMVTGNITVFRILHNKPSKAN
jgi:8-oxo-dGTP diphosphatase